MSYHIFENRGSTLAQLLREVGDAPDLVCGGNGSCGKCRVLASGELTPPDADELALLGAFAARGYRLACRCRANGRCTVRTEINASSAQGDIPDITPERFEPVSGGVGAAIDIGTTTVAVLCVDMESGSPLGSACFVNPQRAVGADVMSRLSYICTNAGGADELHAMLLDPLTAAVKELCPSGLADCAAVAGNTVMEHILCSLDPRGIAVYPFTPAGLLGGEYALPFARGGSYVFPCVSGYVGGDITAGAVACGLDRASEPVLLLDLGTNGELALAAGGSIYTASAAAGPAFEGGNLEYGMCAGEGAVERVWIEDNEIKWSTRGGEPAVGICGSGALDALAALLELGIVDESGAMECGRCPFGERAALTAKDVRALQLAKAAVCAGIRTLCHAAGIATGDIARVMIAGSFGAHVNPASALRIGIVPRELDGRLTAVGNTSLAGAALALTDGAYRERLAALPGRVRHVELSLSPEFNEFYIDEMTFE